MRQVLRCPNCHASTYHIRTRIRTKDRLCSVCGYVGDLKEFEVNPDKPKKSDEPKR